MNRFLVVFALVGLLTSGLALTASAQQEGSGPVCPPEQILVKVLPGADPAEVVARHGGTIVKTIEGINVQVVEVPAGTQAQKVDEFTADPDVKYAEANGVVRATANADAGQCQPPTGSTTP